MTDLIHDLIFKAADHTPDAEALLYQDQTLSYSFLAGEIETKANGLRALGLSRSERVAVYLEKRLETVVALFAASAASGVFAPVNPVLKPVQVAYILADCNVRVLVTSLERLKLLQGVLLSCHDLHTVVVVNAKDELPAIAGLLVRSWEALHAANRIYTAFPTIDSDMAAILYTSGSTGKPKGVPWMRKNLSAGMDSFMQAGFTVSGTDRCLQCFDLTFDVAVQPFMARLVYGACAFTIPHDQIKYSYVYGLMEDHQLTFAVMAPSMIRYLRPYFDEIDVPSMLYFILTAEASPLDLVNECSACIPNA